MNGLLIDTSALSAYFRGHPGVVRAVQSSPFLFLNATVCGETQSGYWAGNSRQANVETLTKFVENGRVEILSITQETSFRYAEIWHFLRMAGKPIPDNDMWIAASAWEHGLILLTLDRHFLALPQIIVRHEAQPVTRPPSP